MKTFKIIVLTFVMAITFCAVGFTAQPNLYDPSTIILAPVPEVIELIKQKYAGYMQNGNWSHIQKDGVTIFISILSYRQGTNVKYLTASEIDSRNMGHYINDRVLGIHISFQQKMILKNGRKDMYYESFLYDLFQSPYVKFFNEDFVKHIEAGTYKGANYTQTRRFVSKMMVPFGVECMSYSSITMNNGYIEYYNPKVPGKGKLISADLAYFIGDGANGYPFVKTYTGHEDMSQWGGYFIDTAVTDMIKFMFKYFQEERAPGPKKDVF